MSKSMVTFQRWKPRERSSWTFQVFQKYDLEFDRLFWSQDAASKFVYKHLKENKAVWVDKAGAHFSLEKPKSKKAFQNKELFTDLKDWSNAFNQFDNWTNLNAVIALTSNLETYMASVIKLALESDPGLLFGAAALVDGMKLLKRGSAKRSYEFEITSCTKGVWQSRISSYEVIFGTCPEILKRKVGELEKVRILRNKVGHAFGRDIEEARRHGVKEILPMENLSREATLKYQRLVWSVAKSIDKHLLFTHIGEFQALRFYHELYPALRKDVHPSERAMIFKKKIGAFKAALAGKLFSKELVNYYESL